MIILSVAVMLYTRPTWSPAPTQSSKKKITFQPQSVPSTLHLTSIPSFYSFISFAFLLSKVCFRLTIEPIEISVRNKPMNQRNAPNLD